MSELSFEDKYLLRENYSKISVNLKPKDVVQELKAKGVLSENDITKLCNDCMKDEKVTEYLIFQLLINCGTTELLEAVKEALIKCNQGDVLQYLPTLVEPEETQDSSNEQESTATGIAEEKQSTDTTDNITKEESYDELDDVDDIEVVRTAGIGNLSIKSIKKKLSFKKKKDKKYEKVDSSKQEEDLDSDRHGGKTERPENEGAAAYPVEEVASASPGTRYPKVKKITNFADAFLNYEPKRPGSRYGRGLCVVFSLFTGDLQGYTKDVEELEKFYNAMEYEVWSGDGFQNLNKNELFSRIIDIRNRIEKAGEFDRLVVAILTHGRPAGLMTCSDKDGFFDEKVTRIIEYPDGRRFQETESEITKVEEIVDCFKHDTLPSLKGMPKLFLIQACRGSGVVKAANIPHTTSSTEEEIVDATGLKFNPVAPIDADIMICYASTENHSSLVNPHTGSWFIQQILEVFRRHYKTQHVADMMTVVSLSVAELRGRIVEKDGSETYAVQIPSIFSTFRRKFYLYGQPQTYILDVNRSNHMQTRRLPGIQHNQYTTTRENPNTTYPYRGQPTTNQLYR